MPKRLDHLQTVWRLSTIVNKGGIYRLIVCNDGPVYLQRPLRQFGHADFLKPDHVGLDGVVQRSDQAGIQCRRATGCAHNGTAGIPECEFRCQFRIAGTGVAPSVRADLGTDPDVDTIACGGRCVRPNLVLRQAKIYGYLRVFLAPHSFLARDAPSRCRLFARGIPSRSPAEGSVAPPCVAPATPRRRASPGTKNPSQLHSHFWT